MPLPTPIEPSIASTPASVVHAAAGIFSVETQSTDPHTLHLVASYGGTRSLWTRHFGDLADRDALLARISVGAFDLVFYGRVTMIFGPAAITAAFDELVEETRKARGKQAAAEAQRLRDAKIITLYTRDSKRDYKLELQRRSDDEAEWSVRYDRASERDRLCDWLRWQKPRFAAFLDHAAKHGRETLTRMLLDEMFETERRIKKEGRGAGGMRPLRMWRGD